jgi:hypothetical protein
MDLDVEGANTDIGHMGANTDISHMPPGNDVDDPQDTFLEDGESDSHVADESPIMRAYHPNLNGKPTLFKFALTLILLPIGRICDEDGNDVPLDMPPPPRDSDKGSDNWTPYNNRLQFEMADFLYRRNQMSAGDIDFLLNGWAASLLVHDDEAPFSKTTHLYSTIDSTPLGDVAWESFSLQYNGPQDGENPPSWMQSEYDVWFRDPRTLVHNLLSNPDFKSGFDYVPYQEHTADGVHRFQDFMSGNWAWNQAVSLCHCFMVRY